MAADVAALCLQWLFGTNEGHKVVAIDNGGNPEYVERCRQHKVVVLEGDATDPALLETAHLDRAAHLIALCGEDAVNARIAVAASGNEAEAAGLLDRFLIAAGEEAARAAELEEIAA